MSRKTRPSTAERLHWKHGFVKEHFSRSVPRLCEKFILINSTLYRVQMCYRKEANWLNNEHTLNYEINEWEIVWWFDSRWGDEDPWCSLNPANELLDYRVMDEHDDSSPRRISTDVI